MKEKIIYRLPPEYSKDVEYPRTDENEHQVINHPKSERYSVEEYRNKFKNTLLKDIGYIGCTIEDNDKPVTNFEMISLISHLKEYIKTYIDTCFQIKKLKEGRIGNFHFDKYEDEISKLITDEDRKNLELLKYKPLTKCYFLSDDGKFEITHYYMSDKDNGWERISGDGYYQIPIRAKTLTELINLIK